MDLTTQYMGMTLRTPIVPSASPLSDDLDNLKRMEDAGAAAVVLHSLFEEQLTLEKYELLHHLTQGTESYAESLTFFPEPEEFVMGPEGYLEQICRAKEAVDIPIIASLNGKSLGGWTDFAKQMEQAGADALELNVYFVPTDMSMRSSEVEQTYIDILRAVKTAVTIPVAMKTTAFFSNFANMAKRLEDEGVDALVLFNRFYQPDINLETLEISPHTILSTAFDLRVPLTWIGILYGRIKADFAATRGIYSGQDAIKMIMAGANVTQVCSALFKHGIEHLRVIEREMRQWMEEREYESVRQMRGSMSQKNCPDPSAFERVQYMRAIQSYRPTV